MKRADPDKIPDEELPKLTKQEREVIIRQVESHCPDGDRDLKNSLYKLLKAMTQKEKWRETQKGALPWK